MKKTRKAILVKDDGHIDPNVWFGRYGIQYRSSQVVVQSYNDETQDNTPDQATVKHLLKIRTSPKGIRRWRLGIQQCKKMEIKGWQRLELRLYIMKHGTTDGFQFKNFNDYQKIVEYYA